MAKYGYITRPRRDRLKARPVCGPIDDAQARIKAPHSSAYFVDYTRRYLIDEYTGATVFGGGLQVTTSLDLDKQAAADDAVNPNLPDTDCDPAAAVVSIDSQPGRPRDGRRAQLHHEPGEPRDGRRRFGTPGGLGVQGVHARDGDGGGFRPQRLLAGSRVDHDPGPGVRRTGGPWTPENAGDDEGGTSRCVRDRALGEHRLRAARAQLDRGPEDVVETAHRAGDPVLPGRPCAPSRSGTRRREPRSR